MYSAGVDLGGTFSKLALVSPAGEILEHRKLPSLAGADPRDALSRIRGELEDMAGARRLPFPAPLGCGIGIPSVVDYRTGWVTLSGPLGWKDLPLGAMARDAFGCEVSVDDDVAAGALADLYFGCARESSDVLYVSWGTGIGAGLILSRRLYHSRGGAMYELGHMPADPESSRRCYCGCCGCLEIEAGGKAMVEKAREALARGEPSSLRDAGEITPERIALAAAAADPPARRILDRSAVLLARVLAGALALLNPDTVVFGGGVSRCFPVIRETFDRELRLRAPGFSLEGVTIAPSAFGDKAGVVGAALLPRHAGEA